MEMNEDRYPPFTSGFSFVVHSYIYVLRRYGEKRDEWAHHQHVDLLLCLFC